MRTFLEAIELAGRQGRVRHAAADGGALCGTPDTLAIGIWRCNNQINQIPPGQDGQGSAGVYRPSNVAPRFGSVNLMPTASPSGPAIQETS